MKKVLCAALLSALFCFITTGCAVSVDQAYDSLKDCPYPFDTKIEECVKSNFPSWSKEEQMQFVIKIFPLTDAGSTYVLMEQAEKHGLLLGLAEYAEKNNNSALKQACQSWIKKANSR